MSFYRKSEIPAHLQQYFAPAEIGLESSPDAFVASMVAVFREVWRVLTDDGVLWLNLGDSYCNVDKWGGGGNNAGKHTTAEDGSVPSWAVRSRRQPYGLKPKDLVGIPWMVAFALRADGWYLRSDIIWHKPNPMPESVTDRPTKSHEYVFLLTKQERYYYDNEAIQERSLTRIQQRLTPTSLQPKGAGRSANGVQNPFCQGGTWDTRNCRSVWTISPTPYAGAHFATFPEKLVERCILAGSRPGDFVLDPFGGSGTTVRVARRFHRRGVLVDLNPAYLALAEDRVSEIQPDLFEVPA